DEARLPEIPDRVPSGRPVVPHLRRPGAQATRRAPAESPAKPAPEHAPRTITVRPGGSIQAAVDQARPGDTIEVEPGTYRQSVLVDVDRITLRGLVKDGQRAILDGEGERTDAVIASGHGFTVEGLALRNYTSNGITVQGATGVVFRDLVVDNTGLYGVYPVQCRDRRVQRVGGTGARAARHGHLHHGRRPHGGDGQRGPGERLVGDRGGRPDERPPARDVLRRGRDPRSQLDPRQRARWERREAGPRRQGHGRPGRGPAL